VRPIFSAIFLNCKMAMDFVRHREVAQELIDGLGKAYNFIGGAFFFVSIHDNERRTLRLAYSDHFINFRDQGLPALKKFFSDTMPHAGWPGRVLWRLETASEITLGKRTVETNVIHGLPPQKAVGSDNFNKYLKRQKDAIADVLKKLDSAYVPYILYYRFPQNAGTGASSDTPDNRKVACFPWEGAGQALLQSVEWQRIISVENMKCVGQVRLVTPAKRKPPARQSCSRQQHNRARTQLVYDDASIDYNMGCDNNDDDFTGGGLQVELAEQSPMEKLYDVVMNPRPGGIPPTVVCNTDDQFMVVMADLVRNGTHKASPVPVLVSCNFI
jgi:hypothetical protein